jgi:cutinase-like protein
MVNGAAEHPSAVDPSHRTRRTRHQISHLLIALAAVLMTVAQPVIHAPTASAAEPCPDVQVVYARGTFEPPGVGVTGQAFVDALRGRLPDKSVDVYPVNYPASLDFARAADGVIDATSKVQDVAVKCPDTKMVLSGYSQGAAVIAYITADSVPADYKLPPGITGPMPDAVAGHVAAVTLFGKPSTGFMNMIDRSAPPITIGSEYAGKALDLCIPADPICSPNGGDAGTHTLYAINGMADQAATFASQNLRLDEVTEPTSRPDGVNVRSGGP